MPDNTNTTPASNESNLEAEKDRAEHLAKAERLRNFSLVFMGAYLSVSLSQFKIIQKIPETIFSAETVYSADLINVLMNGLFMIIILAMSLCSYMCSYAIYRTYAAYLFVASLIFVCFMHFYTDYGFQISNNELMNILLFLIFWLSLSIYISETVINWDPRVNQANKESGNRHAYTREIEQRDELIADLRRRIHEMEQDRNSRP